MKPADRVLLCLLVVALPLGYGRPQPIPSPVYELEGRTLLRSQPTGDVAWDALQYALRLTIYPEQHQIRGKADLTLRSMKDSVRTLRLDFVALRVDTVFVDGLVATFQRYERYLDILLPHPLRSGDTTRVSVVYAGTPTNDGFGGFFFTPRAIYTVGEGIYTFPPSMTRTWLPSLDRPSDKALFELSATVPAPLVVASNGRLQTVVGGDSLTYRWRSSFPMATYLFALAAARYDTVRQDVVLASGDTVPVVNYVYPERKEAARTDYRNVPKALVLFSKLFGCYPFEKYGTALAPCRGAMEHQTLTTISDALVDGSGRYELLFVHELAHQWWGDLVTLQDWPDLWLNEGFASYCEALFAEGVYGRESMRNVLRYFARRYFAEEARLGGFAIYDPPPSYMWGATVYNKGAWVLHMLRFVLGDSTFFRALRAYRQRYEYKNASTRDFQTIVEEVSGKKLDWFFDQWLYRSGHPILNVSWWQPHAGKVILRVEQVQSTGALFSLPLEVELQASGWSQRDTVLVAARADTFVLRLRNPSHVTAQVESLLVDPDGWLLAEFRAGTSLVPGEFALEAPYPNPMRYGTKLRFHWGRTAPGWVRLGVYDIRGRLVRTLIDGPYYGSGAEILWDGTDDLGRPVPAGVYIAALSSGGVQRCQKIVVLPR